MNSDTFLFSEGSEAGIGEERIDDLPPQNPEVQSAETAGFQARNWACVRPYADSTVPQSSPAVGVLAVSLQQGSNKSWRGRLYILLCTTGCNLKVGPLGLDLLALARTLLWLR